MTLGFNVVAVLKISFENWINVRFQHGFKDSTLQQHCFQTTSIVCSMQLIKQNNSTNKSTDTYSPILVHYFASLDFVRTNSEHWFHA